MLDCLIHARVRCAAIVCGIALAAPSAYAADQVYFSANTNVTNILVQYINQETVRLDISSWYLSEHSISIAIANRFNAGVKVRIIGDRGSIFEADPNTKREYYWLASQGIPIRLRFNPTWFPEIDHWKAAIFVGQNTVEFGSGNFAPTELAPNSSSNYDDDSEMFTDDPALVNAFKTKFDRMWNDTTTEPESIIGGPPYLKDWDDACANEPTGNCSDYRSQYPNPKPMIVDRSRLEPDNPIPSDLIFGQGPDFNNRMVQEINSETREVDLLVYRLEVDNITQALLDKFKAGVPVRVIVDPIQYTNPLYPEYWLTHANIDKLWAAGVPILQSTHQGVMHMKTLITSNYATNASSNYGPNWQRDHDYFVPRATKTAIYNAFVNHFNWMWGNSNYAPLVVTPPQAATAVSPSSGATNVSTSAQLVWNRAAYAVSYDVYLGTSPSAMSVVANVPAQMVVNPPNTYSYTASLQGGTTYYWKIVSKTNATAKNPSMIATSSTLSFTTGGSGGGGGGGGGGGVLSPFSGTPVALPGTVNAEKFDNGGEGVAYHDTTAGNNGGQFRTTDVDIENSSEGGFDVGWIAAGEWLNYTVNVTSSGSYTVQFRVASPGGATFHVGFNGPSAGQWVSVSVPATGGWQNWTNVSVPVTLGAGTQQMTIYFDTGAMNFRLATVAGGSGSGGGGGSGGLSPFSGTPVPIPGIVSAEKFDNGGEGVAYHDTTAGNSGGQFRTTDVDVELAAASEGGYDVGLIAAGEWLNYTVNVTAGGNRTVQVRVASPGGATFHIGFNGPSAGQWKSVSVPATGGWQNWTTVSVPVTLGAGTQQMTIYFDTGGMNLHHVNVQ